ncbi:unnamed protein product [Closterium sp. NIES-65]|nr:unnamed protein product [Closterium sp. NIES-65]
MPPTHYLSPFSSPPCPPCLPCLPGLHKPRGEQQASNKEEGQQRRPHQRLRLQYRPCHHTPLEPTPPQVQVLPFNPPRWLAPPPLAPAHSPSPHPPRHHHRCSNFQLSGGEGCGVSTAIPSRLSPVAVQGGTHTGRLGGGLPGKEAPGAAAAALCSLSRLTAKFPQPLACLAMSCAGVQVPPQVQPLGLQFVTWPPPVAPPLSRLANAVPSLALSPFIPSLPTDQLCVCAVQVEGRGGGQH